MSDSVRDQLKAKLEPLLPESWRIIPAQRFPQTIDRITVILKHLEMKRLPEAPMGSLEHEIILTVADPHEDDEKAENALDDAVLELCTVIDGLRHINWSVARKVMVQEPYLGWDITLKVITQKES